MKICDPKLSTVSVSDGEIVFDIDIVNEKESVSTSGLNGNDDCSNGAVASTPNECTAMRPESVKATESMAMRPESVKATESMGMRPESVKETESMGMRLESVKETESMGMRLESVKETESNR
jgi:hypothetical protein